MKKYLSIFNLQTLAVLLISLLSSYICVQYQLSLYVDFLILGIIIVFPLTFSMRVAFRRRERALQYLSLFKASLQSFVNVISNTKLEDNKKKEFKNIARNISDELIEYLLRNRDDASATQNAAHQIYVFVRSNKSAVEEQNFPEGIIVPLSHK